MIKVDWVGVELPTAAMEKVEHKELEDLRGSKRNSGKGL
jgi:hypothetical protein